MGGVTRLRFEQPVMPTGSDDRPRQGWGPPFEETLPLGLWVYLLGALFLAVTALYGGGMLVLDPTGGSVGMPVEWLDGTPFSDYLLPGLVLFGVLGVGALAVVLWLLLRWPGARYAAVGLGVALVGWIVVQVLLLGRLHPFHLVYGGLGALLVGLALLPSVRTAVAPRGRAVDGDGR